MQCIVGYIIIWALSQIEPYGSEVKWRVAKYGDPCSEFVLCI